jgi:hypothetical protein
MADAYRQGYSMAEVALPWAALQHGQQGGQRAQTMKNLSNQDLTL